MKNTLLSAILVLMLMTTVSASQHDYVIANNPGATFRADLNSALQAIVSNNSGATEPTPTYPNMWWYDTSTSLLKRRNNADDAWITLGLEASDTDGTFAANSDSKIPTQKAAKTYIDTTAAVKANKGANSDITSLSGLTTPLSTAQGGTGTTASANAANGIVILNSLGYLPALNGSLLTGISTTPGAGTITSTMLKTTTGEISTSSTSYALFVLPGGEYGFYPQLKMTYAGSSGTGWGAQMYYESLAGITNVYRTLITLKSGRSDDSIYARQRYVTASGTDLWIFLLTDRTTGDIIAAYCAYDHPAYGNGGDFEKTPHPFAGYDEAAQQIILVSRASSAAIKAESVSTGKSVLSLVNEEYSVGNIDQIYYPLHSGKYLTEDGQQVKEMVATLPSYIKVRALIRK